MMRRKAEPPLLCVRGIRNEALNPDRTGSADASAATMNRFRHARVEWEASPQQHRAEVGSVETFDGLAGEPDTGQSSTAPSWSSRPFALVPERLRAERQKLPEVAPPDGPLRLFGRLHRHLSVMLLAGEPLDAALMRCDRNAQPAHDASLGWIDGLPARQQGLRFEVEGEVVAAARPGA
jgi:hypothetical protein